MVMFSELPPSANLIAKILLGLGAGLAIAALL